MSHPAPRSVLIGFTHDFFGVHDGRWKLHKYYTGETLLFDIHDDPLEQHDLSRRTSCTDTLNELDTVLTRELLDSTRIAFFDRKICTNLVEVVTDGERFGRQGWQRTFPFPLTRSVVSRGGYS